MKILHYWSFQHLENKSSVWVRYITHSSFPMLLVVLLNIALLNLVAVKALAKGSVVDKQVIKTGNIDQPPENTQNCSLQTLISIPSQVLKDAITQLAQLCQESILYHAETIKGKRSQAIDGVMNFTAALNRLLTDSGIIVHKVKSTYILSSASNMAVKELDTLSSALKSPYQIQEKLPEIVVVGESRQARCCFNAPSTATKTYVPSFEIPRSIEGIDSALFRDRGNATLTESLKDYSSINTIDQTGKLYLRGFRIYDKSILKSGQPSVSRGISPIPLQNVDGIEIVKGPNASLYGHGQPGGVINLITKIPKPYRFTTVTANYGTHDHYLALDTNSSITTNTLQRTNLLIREERENEDVDGNIRQIQLASAWQHSRDGNAALTFNMEYNQQKIIGLRGPRFYDRAVDGSLEEFALAVFYPDLSEVDFYPFSGPDVQDRHQSDSIDLWLKHESTSASGWLITTSGYAGKSDIDSTSINDNIIWANPVFDARSPQLVNFISETLNAEGNQINFAEQQMAIEAEFLRRYSDVTDDPDEIINAIYAGITPLWNDDEVRFFQQRNSIYQDTEHWGGELSANRSLTLWNLEHNLTIGGLFQQRQTSYRAFYYSNDQLDELRDQLLAEGQYNLGFAVGRHSQSSWYFPYGPEKSSSNVELPDSIINALGLPQGISYPLNHKNPLVVLDQNTTTFGVFLQDIIAFNNRWRANTSLGFYHYDRELEATMDNMLNVVFGHRLLSATIDDESSQSVFVPNFGITYLVSQDISLYASISRQFDIVDGSLANGKALDPEETTAHELGIKWWPRPELNANFTIFQMDKENYALPGGGRVGLANIQQIGFLQSKGVEFNLSGYITPQYKLSTNFAYTSLDSDKDDSISEQLLGIIKSGVPEKNISLWLQYSTQAYGKKGWLFGAGATYLSEREYQLQRLVAPIESTYLIDSSIQYRTEDFNLALTIDNLLDEDWIVGASAKSTVTPDTIVTAVPITAIHAGKGYGRRLRFLVELTF